MNNLKCPVCGNRLTITNITGQHYASCGTHFKCEGGYHRMKSFIQCSNEYLQENDHYDPNQDDGKQLHLNVTTKIYKEFKGIAI